MNWTGTFPGRVVAAALVILACASSAARAEPPTTLEGLLAMTPSPGVEALLLPHASDMRVQQRWREALVDPDPARRAAAARMIGITNTRSALGRVVQAATNEQDPLVLGEVLRALAVIGSASADEVIYRRLVDTPDLSESRLLSVLSVLTVLRPASVVSQVVDVADVETDVVARTIYALLCHVAPDEALRFERGVVANNRRKALRGLLHEAHSAPVSLQVDTLMAGLATDAGTASEVIEYLENVYGTPVRVKADAALGRAYASLLQSGPAPDDPLHALVRRIADRWLGGRTIPIDAGILAGVPADHFNALSFSGGALSVLTRAERTAIASRLEMPDHRRQALLDAKPGAPEAFRLPRGGWRTPAHLVSDLPGAMAADLRRLTGCAAAPSDARIGFVTYRSDGRPATIKLDASTLSASCQRLLGAVASVAYGPPALPGTEPARVVARIDDAWATCLAESDAADPVARRTSSTNRALTPPRLLHRQQPIYPGGALKARIEGVVIVEALVSTTGCVRDAHVTRSIDLLDLAAINAVSAWRYEPFVLDGALSPVTMSISVNFTLR